MQRPIIADTWPRCACGGAQRHALEHSPEACAVMPHVMLQALQGDRELTTEELRAVDQAVARAHDRGAAIVIDVREVMDAALDASAGRRQAEAAEARLNAELYRSVFANGPEAAPLPPIPDAELPADPTGIDAPERYEDAGAGEADR